MYSNKKQSGFTLVEIAIVLVIIGLLLGGILKGQELINSARVRNMADQNSGIQAAYFGFIDRYRQVPGDWAAAAAAQAIGDATVTLGGDGNGRIDNDITEAAAVFSQLAKSNFLGGGFTPATLATAPVDEGEYIANIASPVNAFNGAMILTRNAGFSGSTAATRLNLHMGVNVPVSIARELDIKVDDGLPNTGVLRMTIPDGTVATFDAISFVSNVATCTTVNGATGAGNADGTGADTDIFDVFDDFQDCGQVFVY